MSAPIRPFVSVIIPCRNERSHIGRCLDSVLANDYPADRLEILVVDGMSDDGTGDIVRRIAERGCPVVLCPRSNLFIEARVPPFPAIREAGLLAALGTDSLASNTSLDVLAEARALGDRFSEVPARELVQMATTNGARALGRDDLGRISKGARPGVAAVDGEDHVVDDVLLDDAREPPSPHMQLRPSLRSVSTQRNSACARAAPTIRAVRSSVRSMRPRPRARRSPSRPASTASAISSSPRARNSWACAAQPSSFSPTAPR